MEKVVQSVESLYAHAIAMEREAAARYREFAESMRDHGNDETAELFERLAKLESAHADRLERDTRNLAVPVLGREEFAWLDAGPEVAGAHEFVMRLMSPHDALKIALAGEERAREFFAKALDAARDSDVKALALEMMKDEADHIEWVREALSHEPGPVNWERVFSVRHVTLPPGDAHVIALEEMTPRQRKAATRTGEARKKTPAKRGGAKPAKGAAKKVAVKGAAKKAAKRAAPARALRRGAAKKSPTKKAAVKKPAGKKAAAKKASARKSAAKKPLAGQTARAAGAARKPSAAKPAKKPAAKKRGAKKAKR